MRCDGDGVPQAGRSLEPVGCWLAGSANFLGAASPRVRKGRLEPPQLAVASGLALITVEGARVLGILNPAQPSEPSVWLSWPRAEVKVDGAGRVRGGLSLRHRGSVLDLVTIYRLNPRSKRYIEAQEHSLLDALGAKELTR